MKSAAQRLGWGWTSGSRSALICLLGVALAGCPDGDSTHVVPPKSPVDAGAAAPAKTASALLDQVKGKVTLERDGKKGPAQLGYLYVGDALETGEDGSASIRFSGGRVIELGEEGRFELKEGETGLVLSVAQGLVLTRNVSSAPAQPLGKEHVELTILTPFGFTKLGGDETNLELKVTDKEARVDVKLGTVDLVATDGKVTKIGAGQKGALGGTVMDLEPIQVTISAVSGRADLKRKEDTKWTPLPKKAMALGEGDSFRVKDGRVIMQAPGGQGTLAFSKGSEVTMDKAAKGTGGEEAGFDFKKGELQAQSPTRTRLNLGGGVTITADKASQYTLRRTKDGYELVSVAGDVKIEREGAEPATVYGGRTATIPLKGQVKSEEQPREPVVLPSRSAIKVLQSSAQRLAITWDGEPDKPYRVEVAADPAYKQKLVSGVVRQRHVNVTPPTRGSLYWRVFDENDKEVAKGSASFAPEAAAIDLAHNRNIVHDGADQTTIYFQDKPPAVTFAWQPATEAAVQKYKVQVYRKENLQAAVAEKVVPEDKVMLPEGALGEGSYMWSLKYLDKLGNEIGGTGKMNKLVITYDNAVPNLTIKAPKNGDPGGAKVRCQGIAPVGAKVTVNGRPVPLDEKSRFDTEVAPMGGGLLVFRMVNGASEVYTVRKVRKSK